MTPPDEITELEAALRDAERVVTSTRLAAAETQTYSTQVQVIALLVKLRNIYRAGRPRTWWGRRREARLIGLAAAAAIHALERLEQQRAVNPADVDLTPDGWTKLGTTIP